MLKRFEVEGFKCFDFPLIIDFSDIKQYSFNRDCISNNLLKTLIVYGKNAVGKSNLGLAIFDLVSHLVDRNVTPNVYDFYLNNKGKYCGFVVLMRIVLSDLRIMSERQMIIMSLSLKMTI